MPRDDDPRKRRFDEEDDEDRPPRRRRRPPPIDEDEDEPPRRKRRRPKSDAIQEEPPRRRPPPLDEDEDEPPRRKRRRPRPDDDEKEAPKPKKKKRTRPEDDDVLSQYLRRDTKKHSWDFTPLEEFFIETPALFFYWIPWIIVAIFITFTFIGVLPSIMMLGMCIFMFVLGLAAALVGLFGCKKIYPIGRAIVLAVQGAVMTALGYLLYTIGHEYNMFD